MANSDLSHWQFVKAFSAADTAALICGFDPAQSIHGEDKRIALVEQRMRLDYNSTIAHLRLVVTGFPFDDPAKESFPQPGSLVSNELDRIAKFYFIHSVEVNAERSLNNISEGFDDASFSRIAISNWLEENKLPSQYDFDGSVRKENSPNESKWPWGDHETELLCTLAEAAKQFWSTYDPFDSRTAPKNEEVASWLQDQGVSRNLASAMATILRPAKIPTGPR